MRTWVRSTGRNACKLAGLFCVACLAVSHAQSAAAGQALPPGAQNRNAPGTACVGQEPNPAAPNAVEANCPDLGPNFATPLAATPVVTRPQPVTSIIRVDAPLPKPPVDLPPGDTFNTVGSATLVKTRRETLDACLASGRRWSARSNAVSSTTCLDQKGEVIAFQECKPASSSPECTVVLPRDSAKESTKTP